MTFPPGNLSGSEVRVAFVQACWHREIVDEARDSFLSSIEALGYGRSQIDLFEVPGTLEIPLHAKRLAETGRFAAIVAAALVVNGGIYRHEFVSATVIDGLMRVQLETGVPILSAVLTPQTFHEQKSTGHSSGSTSKSKVKRLPVPAHKRSTAWHRFLAATHATADLCRATNFRVA